MVGAGKKQFVAESDVDGGEQLAAARAALAEAEAALREADWDAFGRAMQTLKESLAQ